MNRLAWVLVLVLGAGYLLAATTPPGQSQAAVWQMGKVYGARLNDDAGANTASSTTTSAQITFTSHQVAHSSFIICAEDASTNWLCGTNPTAGTTYGTDVSFRVFQDACTPTRFKLACVDTNNDNVCDERKCAHRTASGTATVVIYEFEELW